MLKTTSFFVSVLIMLLFLIIPKHFVAQPQQVAVGDKLRVNIPPVNTAKIVGVVDEISNTGILLSTRDGKITIPFNAIQDIHVSRGKKSRWKLGFALGYVSGAIVGSMFTEKPKCNPSRDSCIDFTELDNALKVGLGASIGALAGTIIGTTIKTDRWEKVPLKMSMGLSHTGLDNRSLKPAVSVRFSLNSQ